MGFLRVYGLYESDKPFPDMYYLVLHHDEEIVTGLMFSKETLEMYCLFTLKRPVDFRVVDYLYIGPQEKGLRGPTGKKFVLKLRERSKL